MNKTVLHLSLIPSIGPAVISKISCFLSYEDFDQLYHWSARDFMAKTGLSVKIAKILVDGLADDSALKKELDLIQSYGVNWVTCDSDSYPRLLQAAHLPPPVLYWLGREIDSFEKPIALVGSRKANSYGRRVITSLVSDLASAHCTLVSGGALGADTMVHQAALDCGGVTCAVIGSGLLQPYPASNKQLFKNIVVRGGSLVSSFPLLMKALPGNFPARNRIISGMTIGTVVVQAAVKSGARITALYALEQGREVCAVPGSIEDPLSMGCHKLIHEGATLVSSGSDVLHACGYAQKIVLSKKMKRTSCIESLHPLLVQCREPQTFDDLLNTLDFDFCSLQERLMHFQLEGKIKQDFLGRWLAC